MHVELSTNDGETGESEMALWDERQKQAAKQRWDEDEQDLTDAPLEVKVTAIQKMLVSVCKELGIGTEPAANESVADASRYNSPATPDTTPAMVLAAIRRQSHSQRSNEDALLSA